MRLVVRRGRIYQRGDKGELGKDLTALVVPNPEKQMDYHTLSRLLGEVIPKYSLEEIPLGVAKWLVDNFEVKLRCAERTGVNN